MEDVTDPENIRQNPKCDRNVCLYGYVRGTHFKPHSNIHIPGNVISFKIKYFIRKHSVLPSQKLWV